MEDFFIVNLVRKFFTEHVNMPLGMVVLACVLLVLGTRAVRAFLHLLDIAMVPIREFFRYMNKWTGGLLGQFFWVGNCGLWLLSGMFVAAFGFAEHKLGTIGYITSSIAYGIGWLGIGMTIVASLAITRIWLRLEDPKKRQKKELANEKS